MTCHEPLSAAHAEPVPAPDFADPYRAYRTVGMAFVAAVLFVSLAELAMNFRDPTVRDFISFWGAGKLALAGQAAGAYDKEVIGAVQALAARFHGGEMPFPYPPSFLLLVAPFALLPYPVAMVAFVAATFAAFIFAVRRMFPDSGWLAAGFPPVFICAATGQNGFLTSAIFIGGLLLLRSRPFAAGLLLGCLILKPQLAMMLPVAMLASRQWKTIAGAALSSVAVLAAGFMAFGVAAAAAWYDQLPLYVSIGRDGLVGWQKLASVYATARQAGVGQSAAFAIHGAVAVAAAAATWRVWRSDAGATAKAAVLAAATMLASPYLFLYDSLILVVPFLWLAGRRVSPALIGALWSIPMVSVAQIYALGGPVNLNAVMPIALLVLAWREITSKRSRNVLAHEEIAAPTTTIVA